MKMEFENKRESGRGLVRQNLEEEEKGKGGGGFMKGVCFLDGYVVDNAWGQFLSLLFWVPCEFWLSQKNGICEKKSPFSLSLSPTTTTAHLSFHFLSLSLSKFCLTSNQPPYYYSTTFFYHHSQYNNSFFLLFTYVFFKEIIVKTRSGVCLQ